MPAYIHLFVVGSLMLAPPAICYNASHLSEIDTKASVLRGFIAYLGSALIKLVLLAVLGSAEESLHRDVVTLLVANCDVPIMWWCLNKLNHQSVSISEKFLSVGIGWMVADTLCRRVISTAAAALAEDFTWDTVLSGVQANISLAHSCAFAALVTLLWSRKVKIGSIGVAVLLMSSLCAMLPQLPLILQQRGLLKPGVAVGMEAISTAAMCVVAFISHQAAATKNA